MAQRKKHHVDLLGDALTLISKGFTYAETAVRSGAPYWLISGSIRKIPIPMLYEEKDRIEEFAKRQKTTAPEMIMDMVNFYWDDYVKRHTSTKKAKKR